MGRGRLPATFSALAKTMSTVVSNLGRAAVGTRHLGAKDDTLADKLK